MKVKLLTYTFEPLKAIAASARLCYSPLGIDGIQQEMSCQKMKELVQKLVASGHLSPLEHASFTFGIEGISRVTSHQLVRHRIASYSQQSQRYVNTVSNDFIVPPSVAANSKAEGIYTSAMEWLQCAYSMLLESGIPGEDARYILPNATETKIVVTMNVRSLINFFGLRMCERAQWEIREMARHMHQEVAKVLPEVFEGVGAHCETSGFCPEGAMGCGKKGGK